MKNILTLLVVLLNFIAFSQRVDSKIIVNKEVREFTTFKPSGAAPSGGYPLVFMLHGTNQTGPQFYNISGWKEVAEREKFIVVFPTALVYCTTKEGIVTKWSQGNTLAILCPGDTLKDEVPFFTKMIDTIASILPINKKKIFACGFSSGGTMAAKLTIKMPGIFAAAAFGSGNLDERDSMAMKPKIPTWAIRGTHDHNFFEVFGRPCPFNDTALVINSNNLDNHLGSMGLSWKFQKDSSKYYINYTFTDPLPGQSPAFFRWSIYLGLEHEFFNGVNYLPGNPAFPTEAELFWEFFKEAAGNPTTPIQEVKSNSMLVKMFPNPSIDHVTIEVPFAGKHVPINYYVINAQGKLVLSGLTYEASQIRLSKAELGNGIFFVNISQGNKVALQKIVFI